MKKRVSNEFIILFLLIITAGFVAAQTNSSEENLEKAYQCVATKVGNNCYDLSFENQAFAILSLGNYGNCKEAFHNNSKAISGGLCWPKQNCNPKDTALAILVLNRLGEDTSPAENWLLSQTKTASDLTWYIQIESSEPAKCSVSYGEFNYEFEIFENKKLSAKAGNCLSLSLGNYWYEIGADDSCINYQYTFSCDKDFQTNMLYRSKESTTIHVSQKLNFNSAGGETKEKISYECFKKGTVCDYESTLWASYALYNSRRSVGKYLPYIEASMSEKSSFFPEAFLYIMSRDKKYETTILTTNFKREYWNAGINSNRFYDSALGFLSIGDRAPEKTDAVRTYLLEKNQQGSEGCWNNLRDTGFLLYSAWDLRDVQPPVSYQCQTDSNCALGKICVDNFCVEGCREDNDCEYIGENFVCHNEQCVNNSLICEANADCPEDTPFCDTENNLCLECLNNTHCDGLICSEGMCVEECESDGDCDLREICLGNVCKTGCRNDTQCASGMTCDLAKLTCVSEYVPTQSCTLNNYFCVDIWDCPTGSTISGFSCSSNWDVCCREGPVIIETCAQKNGYICTDDERCPGTTISGTSDIGECCSVRCVEKENNQPPPTYTCPTNKCKSSCSSDERISSLTCASGYSCCEKTESPTSYLWIYILVALIILVVILILLRDKISLLIFKIKGGKDKTSPSGARRPPFPPSAPVRPMPPRQFAMPISRPPARAPPLRAPPQKKDSEFDDTLKKLKEMSK
jgi:hypothetical protein